MTSFQSYDLLKKKTPFFMQCFCFSFTTFNLDLSSTNTDTYQPQFSQFYTFLLLLYFITYTLSPSNIHTYCTLQLFLPQTTCTLTVPLSRDPDISWWIWRQWWQFTFLLPSLYLTFLPFRPLLSSSSLVCCAERELDSWCVCLCVYLLSFCRSGGFHRSPYG